MIPFPIVLSAPSGGGKTTVTRRLLQQRADIGYSVSCTTRNPREGEVDGRDYHFLTEAEFRRRRARRQFAESAEVHGRMYGTLRSEVRKVLGSGRHVIMDIDVQGARQFHAAFPESVLIFLLPPSGEVLLRRLVGRDTEGREMQLVRLRAALQEIEEVRRYHYVVVNDDLEATIRRVSSIVDAEEVRHERVPRVSRTVRTLVAQLKQEVQRHAKPTR
ncbi:MAG: guanylate kinase [Gemmatimonadetes bacterium]|nr:guanylate kinase [Gemmatimonadota bacterium]